MESNPRRLLSYAQRAEELGFDAIFVIDHLLRPPSGYLCDWLEPLTTLSHVSAVTQRAKLGTLMLILPLRQPVLAAKELATLDVLSGGRLIVGVSAGWSEPEFHASGIPLRQRGARLEESLSLLKRLWSEDHVSFRGRFYSVEDVSLQPKPLQKPHPPLWLGGGSQPFREIYGIEERDVQPALRRVAALADGWVPHAQATPAMIRRDWETIKRVAARLGREAGSIVLGDSPLTYIYRDGEEEARRAFARISTLSFEKVKSYYLVGTPTQVADRIKERLRELPETDYIIPTPVTYEEAQLEMLARDVMPQIV